MVLRTTGAVPVRILVDIGAADVPAVQFGRGLTVDQLPCGADFIAVVLDYRLADVDKGTSFHDVTSHFEWYRTVWTMADSV